MSAARSRAWPLEEAQVAALGGAGLGAEDLQDRPALRRASTSRGPRITSSTSAKLSKARRSSGARRAGRSPSAFATRRAAAARIASALPRTAGPCAG